MMHEFVIQLVHGWRERIEYAVCVNGRTEQRACTVWQDSLMKQLKESIFIQKSRENCEISSPGILASPHPGNLDASDLLFRIERDLEARPEILTPDLDAGREILTPDLDDAREILKRHVREARIILGYDQPMRMLNNTVCGECAGALIVARDANSDVRCIGTPAEASCGAIYRRWQWIELAAARA